MAMADLGFQNNCQDSMSVLAYFKFVKDFCTLNSLLILEVNCHAHFD